MLLPLAAGQAFAASEVRLLHAVPGGPAAQLELSGGEGEAATTAAAGFGEASDRAMGPSGEVTLTLVADGEQLGRSSEALEDGGRYTVVAAPRGDGASLLLYEDGEPVPGRTRWRMVHAAAELETAEFVLGDRVVGRLSTGDASAYETVEPGGYALGARRPGEDEPLVRLPDASLVAGTAQSAYLVGSAGEQARFVVLEDGVAAPEIAPATGLGGLAEGGGAPWLLAALAAVVAGALGGGSYLLVTARRPRARARG